MRSSRSLRRVGDGGARAALLHAVDEGSLPAFTIDRHDPHCLTPRRNPAVDAALAEIGALDAWCAGVDTYFRSELFPVQQAAPEVKLDLTAIATGELFSPVVPLFEGDGQGGAAGRDAGGLLPTGDLTTFLAEQARSLNEKLATAFPQDDSVITSDAAGMLVSVMHSREVGRDLHLGVDYVEAMLREQLIAPIGKVVSPVDFADHIVYHHRRLFKPEFRPGPFSDAIRRPDHDPEGNLTLEVRRPEALPIVTLVRQGAVSRPMRLRLDAATQVAFPGERYLHGWVPHQFSSSPEPLTLVARARRFSNFILIVGRIISADRFEPRHAVTVQNLVALENPLSLEPIPTPKELREAIESLAPEQQRFAKAFRARLLMRSIPPSPAPADPSGATAGIEPVAAPPEPAPKPAPSTDAATPEHTERPAPRMPSGEGEDDDYIRMPVLLDKRLDQLDADNVVRPTIIYAGDPWTKRFRRSLLADIAQQSLCADERRTANEKALDLRDALSKSGDLELEDASPHCVIAASHCFEQTLLDPVIQGNLNPLGKVQRSSMILTTTIHDQPAATLLLEDRLERFFVAPPQLELPEDPSSEA